MPHYRDGKEAKLGDLVRGVSYNRDKRVIVGTIVSITPGTDSCNCMVAFVATRRLELPEGETPYSDKWRSIFEGKRYQLGDGHGGKQHVVTMVEPDVDYAETRAFELVHRDE